MVNRHLIFNFYLSKLYTNSLLSSLNARTPQGAGSADSGKTALMTFKSLASMPVCSGAHWARGVLTRRSMQVPPPQRSSVFIDLDSIRVSDVELGGRREVG